MQAIRTLTAITIALGSFFYFLPFAIAFGREHKNTGAVFTLNLFLGWTFIGWVIALVWSLTN